METDELAQYLNALQREDCYRVDATLKESPFETTQRVYFIGANGAESGPYIRKFIKRESGMGSAYERIHEAQKAGKRFRHIPRVIDCYTHGEQLAVVMEYVQGETLQDYVYRNDPSQTLANHVFPQLCNAVAELHDDFDPPIIHRDLKPSNIILSDNNLTIIDFGISREFKDDAETDTAQFGTRAFAPPEQFGYGQTTVRSDVYALGMLLYFCLTERIPDAAARAAGFADPMLTPEMQAVIRRATQFDPENRYESASALKQAFEAARTQVSWREFEGADTPANSEIPPSESAAREWPGAPEAPSSEPRYHLVTLRNIVVVAVLAGLLGLSLSLAFNPTEEMANWPTWYRFAGYLVILPIICLGSAWAFLDKRWFAQRFPALAQITTGRWITYYVAFLIIMFLIASVAAWAAGVS